MIKQAWQSLQNRCATCAFTTLILGGAVAGLIAAGLLLAGGAYGLAWTNTEGFCIGCHEMRSNPYAEYQDTIHDKNRSGVRAICSDCHVPREPGPMLVRKVEATFELWGHFVSGVIDTKEKYEKHRYDMAKKVWTRKKKRNRRDFKPDMSAEGRPTAAMDGGSAGNAGSSSFNGWVGRKPGISVMWCHRENA